MKKYNFYIGVDISKPFVDFMVSDGKHSRIHAQVANDPESLKAFLTQLRKLEGCRISNCIFGMEHTGIYSNHLLTVLHKLKADVVNENSIQIKNSLGLLRGKNDKLDAFRIAEYLFICRDKLTLWTEKRDIISELSRLLTLRERLIQILHNLKVPLKQEKGFINKNLSAQNLDLCSASIAAVKTDIIKVEQKITSIWTTDKTLEHFMRIILSVPCVGQLTALNIIISSNEFKTISTAKKFACYAGVAPFSRQSGTSVSGRSRVSHAANKKTKSLLHTCAVLSVRFVPELKAYFLRKTQQEKKHRMLVYNAIRSKIILRVFSCINNERMYQKDYVYTPLQHQ